jgi:hypothetical protein
MTFENCSLDTSKLFTFLKKSRSKVMTRSNFTQIIDQGLRPESEFEMPKEQLS